MRAWSGDVADVEDGASVDGFGAEFGERRCGGDQECCGDGFERTSATIITGRAIHLLVAKIMRNTILVGLTLCGCLFGQVKYDADDKTVSIDGKPFTTFNHGREREQAVSRAAAIGVGEDRDPKIPDGDGGGREPRPPASPGAVVFL